MKLLSFYCYLAISLILGERNCQAQSYGLQFAGGEVVQDERTGLTLTPTGPIYFSQNFKLTFDLAFAPEQPEYFGYIFRMISAQNEHVDLIYDNNPQTRNHLRIVVNEKEIEFPYAFDKGTYFTNWVKIKLDYSRKDHILSLTANKMRYRIKLGRPLGNYFDLYFGANSTGMFKTTDVPPMRLRDIEVSADRALSYKWPLNEQSGTKVTELFSGTYGIVKNPTWIKQLHAKWTRIEHLGLKGPASIAFDTVHDVLYIVGSDLLYRFSVINKTLTSFSYPKNTFDLMRGNQSFYEATSGKLYNLYIDQAVFSIFDFKARKWDQSAKPSQRLTDLWHFNKFYSPTERAFYLFGGYGHFIYKDTIRRYDPVLRKLSTIKPVGDFCAPRYLAALGTAKNGAYIIGGYGSSSGKQILNPQNLYDLLFFDTRSSSIKKIYNLKNSGKDFVFANSLIVDEREDSYYGLIFPNNTFNSRLRLVKGSLSKPELIPLADEIPFSFQDTKSFSDLFYSKKSGKFIAVTIFTDDQNISTISIYSLANPPLTEYQLQQQGNRKFNLPAILIMGLALIIFLFTLAIINRKRPFMVNYLHRRIKPSVAAMEGVNEEILIKTQETEFEYDNTQEQNEITDFQYKNINTIFLFGDFQVFDKEGKDITRHFTPLVKELFLIVLLYTFQWGTGISSEKLKELLWPHKSTESARNNRSVNITKLKTILDRMSGCQISKESGTWQIIIDVTKVRVDYYDYLTLVRDKRKVEKQKILKLAEISKRGNMLTTSNYEWLDTFKSEVSNEIIDTYLHYANSIPISKDPVFLIKLAGYIFKIDSVNEEAMILKCKVLVHMGKHSLAKATFDNFCREYHSIYTEDFNKDFPNILE